MGVFTRIRRLLKANINDALDKAENPAKMLNYLILEMQEGLDQAREEVAGAMAAERRLALQATEADGAAREWTERARRAVEHRNDELAREALRRKVAAAELTDYYRQAHAQQVETVSGLQASLKKLEKRMRDAQAKRSTVLAQLEAAKAQQVVSRSLRQAVGTDAFAAFDRIALEVQSLQHRTAALAQLTTDELEDAFLVSEEASAVEKELVSLKKEMGYLEGTVEPEPAALEQQSEEA